MEVSFSVEDTGMGIARRIRREYLKVFGRYMTRIPRNLSVQAWDLLLCVRLLKLMGSNLILESEKGKGSKFSFDLKLEYARQRTADGKKSGQAKEDNLDGNEDIAGGG